MPGFYTSPEKIIVLLGVFQVACLWKPFNHVDNSQDRVYLLYIGDIRGLYYPVEHGMLESYEMRIPLSTNQDFMEC